MALLYSLSFKFYMAIPDYLTEDEAFYYCPKDFVNDVKDYEYFIPLSDLLEDSTVSNAYYNVIGQIKGKNVIVI